ncbi:hypothetical protein HZB01_04805 [Candidatus Woesearchaeota archaeon]|nr:hypothetical protein [Candidatus Woesearchaeota archaeon]
MDGKQFFEKRHQYFANTIFSTLESLIDAKIALMATVWQVHTFGVDRTTHAVFIPSDAYREDVFHSRMTKKHRDTYFKRLDDKLSRYNQLIVDNKQRNRMYSNPLYDPEIFSEIIATAFAESFQQKEVKKSYEMRVF